MEFFTKKLVSFKINEKIIQKCVANQHVTK